MDKVKNRLRSLGFETMDPLMLCFVRSYQAPTRHMVSCRLEVLAPQLGYRYWISLYRAQFACNRGPNLARRHKLAELHNESAGCGAGRAQSPTHHEFEKATAGF